MFSWRRKLPVSSVVAFLVAGACAAAAFASVASERGGQTSALGSAPVVTAVRDLPAGTVLTTADLAVTDVVAAPPGAVADPALVAGHTTVTPFTAGEAVVPTRLAAGGGPLTVAVPPGLVAITVAPDTSPRGIVAGDRVDVVATYLTARPYASTVGDDLAVLAVGGGDDPAGEGTLTLIADPITAQDLARADATAALAVAVRGYEPVLP
jgi:Flp pilus assembly protein CpaB